MNFEELINRLRLLVKNVGAGALAVIPGIRRRNIVRAFIYRRIRAHIPIHMLVESGEQMMQIGTPNPSTLRILARRVGNHGHVLVVEASSKNVEDLRRAKSKMASEGARIDILHKAAYSERATLRLEVSEVFPGDNLLMLDDVEVDNHDRPGQQFSRIEDVEAIPLDDLLDKLDRPPMSLVLTINGAELAAVEGASDLLAAMPIGSRVFVKTHAKMANGESIFDPVRRRLEEAGFIVTKSRSSQSVSSAEKWQSRTGDAFGFKP